MHPQHQPHEPARSTKPTPQTPQHETPRPGASHGIVRGHVVTAVEILRARLAEPWTLDSLAGEVHLSCSQLARSFAATVGMSPMAYLRKMRVERMARLLASTDLSVAEAARTVGWRNQFHASQCFHAHYGVSPTGFRRRQSTPPVD
jgi:transcriptional regulator GlxA family with amidase domain